MKYIFLFLFTFFLALSTYSQKQKVYSIVKQPQSVDWYKNQLDLWTAEIKMNSKNTEAWQNAYIAMRMIKIQSTFKTQKDLNEFITKMQKAIPNTYEYHYLTYYNREVEGDKYDKLFHHVEKAYKLDPNRTEIYPDLVKYHLMKGNELEYTKYSKLWFNSNSLSTNLLNFGYNVLASCEDKSVLITNGDNDTYPLFLVQESMNFKPNVEVLNIYLLQKEGYRNSVFKKLGIKGFDKNKNEFKDNYAFMKAIARHMESELNVPLYYSSTVNPGLYKETKDKVYVTGLALKYSENKFDNIAILKKNVEQSFKLDYLTSNFFNDISKQIVINSNYSYLTGFLTLYRHYSESGDLQKKQWLGNILKNIAEINPNKDYILNFMKEC
ncbi:hypothetical protein N9544_01550 [Flavobacteriales bacterium]|nr:hypothetical protein [Flavobacteriales bacterium]